MDPIAWIRSRLPDGDLRESCQDLFHLYEIDEDECDAFEFSYEKVSSKNFRKFEVHIRQNAKKKENVVPRQATPQEKAKKRKSCVAEDAPSPQKMKPSRPSLAKPAPGYVVPVVGTGASSQSARSIKFQFQKDAPNKPYGPTTMLNITGYTSDAQTDMSSQRRAEAIDARIDTFRKLIKLPCEEGEVGLSTRDEIALVGRILCEVDGKLNDQSMLLEGSRVNSNGQRVKLFVDERVPRLTCFSGQIVGVKGRSDPLGEQFVATQIIPGLPTPLVPAVTARASTSRVVVACGPYTPKASLDFHALHSVLEHAQTNEVDLVVLMGPFLDASHPIIQSGAIVDEDSRPIPLEDLYSRHIIPTLDQFATSFNGKLLLIPSTDEVLFFYRTIPQPPLNVTSSIWNIPTAIFGANPCFAEINGVNVCFTSHDIVAPLVKDMVVREPENAPEKTKKNEEAMKFILWQRSLFPSHSRGGAVDCVKRSHYEFFDKVPSAIIFPSTTGRGFLATIVENRFFVNPGVSQKPSQAGTFADMMISAENSKCRCDIWKI
eukprot:GEMP01007537.1.p1 GENE.GEMP01007537.1~~GEMP01007537.1.p1  ORF type:complete len:545 (+),score=100.36 GEMP01007537.1:230-1864(+)